MIASIRSRKKALSFTQESSLIALLTYKCRKPTVLRIRKLITCKFYSLRDTAYWHRLRIVNDYIEYDPLDTFNISNEISSIRKDLLKQYKDLFPHAD